MLRWLDGDRMVTGTVEGEERVDEDCQERQGSQCEYLCKSIVHVISKATLLMYCKITLPAPSN
jgi:hypothetical protein